jgi:hypothetical protein
MGFGEGFNNLTETPIIPSEAIAPQQMAPETIIPTSEATVTTPEIAETKGIENTVPTPTAFTEEDFLNYAKSKGKEVKSFEELFLEKEPVVQEKIINPWEDILDDEDKQYLTYKKETGRSRKDFDNLNTDYDSISSLDLAREKVRNESGQKLTDEQADLFLERKLGVDLSDLNDLEDYDNIELATFSKSLREEKKLEQQKYKQPITSKQADSYVR